jgi:hypothetical protein
MAMAMAALIRIIETESYWEVVEVRIDLDENVLPLDVVDEEEPSQSGGIVLLRILIVIVLRLCHGDQEVEI